MAGASVCLSWGNSVCQDWELCLFTFTAGMYFCVWCVSWYQRYQVCFIVVAALCPGKYVGTVCACFLHLSCTWLVTDGKSPVCVSANNGLQLTTHPHAEARPTHLYPKHSRPHFSLSLLFFLHFLPPSLLLLWLFFLLFIPSCLFLSSSQQSAKNQFFSTLHDCAHMWMYKCVCMVMYTKGDRHETDVKLMKVKAEYGQMTPALTSFVLADGHSA